MEINIIKEVEHEKGKLDLTTEEGLNWFRDFIKTGLENSDNKTVGFDCLTAEYFWPAELNKSKLTISVNEWIDELINDLLDSEKPTYEFSVFIVEKEIANIYYFKLKDEESPYLKKLFSEN